MRDRKNILLGDVCSIKTGKRNNQDKDDNGLYPFFVRSSVVEKINTYSFDGEAILMPGEGNIGDIIHYINGKFDFHQRVYKISNFDDDICGKYVFYALQKSFKKWALKNTVKATVDSLRLPTFQTFSFYAPKKEYQEKIVQMLDTVVNHISNLEKLISKQESIKKTTVKMLLTPQSNWIHTNIGSLVTVLRGESLRSKNFVSGNIPVVAGGVGIAGYHNKSNRPVNTITISASGANAGFINFYKKPIFATDCSTISETNSLDTLFLYYVLKSKQDSIFKMQTGGAQPHVHPKDISRINIFIPNLDEQQRIATQLSEIDAHIENLKQQLAKQRAIKQGLMDYFFGN